MKSDIDSIIKDFENSSLTDAPALMEQTPYVLEERLQSEDIKESAEKPVTSSKTRWLPTPSVRNQMVEHPLTVRYANPETKVLSLSKPEDLREFNRIQKASSDIEAPTLSITELEKQQHAGSWTVLITFYEVQYTQL